MIDFELTEKYQTEKKIKIPSMYVKMNEPNNYYWLTPPVCLGQCLDEKCDILNATVAQRSKFIQLIDEEPSVQVIQNFSFSSIALIPSFNMINLPDLFSSTLFPVYSTRNRCISVGL